MSNKTIINRPVDVTAVYFNNRRGMESYPRRIEFDNQAVTFREGIGVRVGDHVQRYDMRGEGNKLFSLRCQDGNAWTLLAITSYS